MFQHGKIIMMTNDLDDQRFKIIEMAKVIEIIEMTGVFKMIEMIRPWSRVIKMIEMTRVINDQKRRPPVDCWEYWESVRLAISKHLPSENQL